MWNNIDIVAVTKCWHQWIHFCGVLVQRFCITSNNMGPCVKQSLEFRRWAVRRLFSASVSNVVQGIDPFESPPAKIRVMMGDIVCRMCDAVDAAGMWVPR